MRKIVFVGVSALAIAGGTLVYAHQGLGPDGPRWRPNLEDLSALANARIAALHAGLQLNVDQEKNWPPVESALRELAKQQQDQFASRDKAERGDPLERLNFVATAMQARGAALAKLGNVAAPLYGSLDDAQKRRLLLLARGPHGGPHFAGPPMPPHRGPGPDEGRGFDFGPQ